MATKSDNLGFCRLLASQGWQDFFYNAVTKYELPAMPKGKLHVTVCYDQSGKDSILVDIPKSNVYKATITGFKVLGKNNDIIAMTLASDEIQALHNELKEAGYEHSFPELLIHMSIAYDLDYKDIYLLTKLFRTLIGTELTFDRFDIKQIKD